jgi:hypothetical protein
VSLFALRVGSARQSQQTPTLCTKFELQGHQ